MCHWRAVAGKYTRHLGDSSFDIVVYHDGVGNLVPPSFLLTPERQPLSNGLGVVSAHPQALRLDLWRWRQEHDENGVGMAIAHLLCALQVYLEQDIVSGRRDGPRCSVTLAQELRPLEKGTFFDHLVESRPVHENVGVVCLTITPGASGVRAAQPKPGLALDQPRCEGALAGPARA